MQDYTGGGYIFFEHSFFSRDFHGFRITILISTKFDRHSSFTFRDILLYTGSENQPLQKRQFCVLWNVSGYASVYFLVENTRL